MINLLTAQAQPGTDSLQAVQLTRLQFKLSCSSKLIVGYLVIIDLSVTYDKSDLFQIEMIHVLFYINSGF